MSHSLLILNARVANEGLEFESDVLVRDGRIEKIAPSIDADADQTLDAAGLLLMPGFIDDQVHFREPGLTHKGDIASESRAAVAGGITSFMEMPNTSPPTVTAERLEEKYAIAENSSHCNYSFYLGATNDNLEDIQRLEPNHAAGIKIFMGASTGNMLVDDPVTLDGIFRDAPCIVATHCEDTPTITANQAAAEAQYPDGIPISAHPDIRSEDACYKSSSLAVELAKKHGTRLHVLHLTTGRELDLFTPGPIEDKQITVEACVHHLFFSADDYAERGNYIKCNPAIKARQNRDALVAAVREDRIDVIATDHAPHTLAEKDVPYPAAAAGLPLVQDALSVVLELVHRGELDLHTAIRKTSHDVARRFQIVDRGFIREGYWADLTLVDLAGSRTVAREDVLSKCGWSPFEGLTFSSRIAATIVSGAVAYRDGEFGEHLSGLRLEYDR